ncbi:MAG: dihydrolipoyl dehydrogenase [Clostridiales bacterium]|nr:MAG: dihydrolipoyl dehydrogenase [Clostridiales bacterium]
MTGGVAKKLAGLGVNWVREQARIVGKHVGNYVVAAGGEQYSGKRLLIATGSKVFLPPIDGLDEALASEFALTSREILEIQAVPEHLVVIGGGVIGLEMASYYKAAGSQVTIVEMLDAIGGPQEPEIAEVLRESIEKMGITVLTGHQVTSLKGNAVSCQKGSDKKVIACDKVLLSVGRRPVTEDIGLATIGVLTKRGAVVTDDNMRTNLPGVYAAGDVNGKSLLAHTAYREAEVAVNHMLGVPDKMVYNAIPSVIYTNPEVAAVGITEAEAKRRALDYRVEFLSMRYAGRYEAENEMGKGICKVLFDNKWNTILGAHMIGNHTSELVWGVDALIAKGVTVEDIKKIVFPHPTVSEIIREAVFSKDKEI